MSGRGGRRGRRGRRDSEGREGRLLRGVRELAGERPLTATVRGGSMAPLLVDGDQVALSPTLWPLPGDIVAFRSGDGRLVVHRVLGYRWARGAGGIACVTRGDASPRADPPFARDRLLGRVIVPASVLPTFAARRRALAAFVRLVAQALRRKVVRRPRGAVNLRK